MQVAEADGRRSGVLHEEGGDVVAEDALVEDPHRRDAQTLTEVILGVDVEGAGHRTAGVGPVALVLGEGDDLVVLEDRPDETHVVEVGAAPVGVVDREDAGVDVVAELVEDGLALEVQRTWTAMSWLPCITVLPWASQSAEEKSRL